MIEPTQVEVSVFAMKHDTDGARLTRRDEEADFYDVMARRVETDHDRPDWTGEIVVLDEVENIALYHNAVEAARQMCIKHGLKPDDWQDEGD